MSARFTANAKEHIRAIRIYSTQRWGKEVAEAYASVLRAAITGVLDRSPSSGRDHSDDLFPGVRSFLVESHVIYYREIPAGIVILAVLHERQDPNNYL